MSRVKQHLVFLPGTLCTEATFAHQVDHLQDLANITILPLFEGASISASAASVLEKSPETFVLVGFSQGAIVAFEIMRRAPERVAALCLMSANPRGSTETQRDTWRKLQADTRAGGFPELAKGFANNVHPDRQDDKALTDTITQMAHAAGPEVFITQLDALASRSDSRPFLNDIRCPTLLMVGRQDRVTPLELLQEIQDAVPQAALVPVEDSGHYLPLERPQAVTAVLRHWLQTF